MDAQEKARRAKDKRLQKLYGITLRDYYNLLAEQNGVCSVCLRPPATVALSVDHDHKWKYLKLKIWEIVGLYVAKVEDPTTTPDSPYLRLKALGYTKKEARAALKQKLKRASIRGLLCVWCNTGLRKYRDNPENLIRAAEYLRQHQGR